MRAAITATGHYVPSDVYSNAHFASRLETTDEWIRSRTGIVERRFAATGGTSDLVVPAARRCLAQRGIAPAAVDCVIVATMTPDRLCPSTAAVVQRKLGAVNAWGFDLAAACSGFVYGLVVATKMVESGVVRSVLLCGADRMSSVVNADDRATAVLFGDGAGVVLVEAADDESVGILDQVCWMDGEGESGLTHTGRRQRPAGHRGVGDAATALRRAGRARGVPGGGGGYGRSDRGDPQAQ